MLLVRHEQSPIYVDSGPDELARAAAVRMASRGVAHDGEQGGRTRNIDGRDGLSRCAHLAGLGQQPKRRLGSPDPHGDRGGVITVVGVVFSITIVALTLASTQFGPRMLRNFIRDRFTQFTLGTFASFFYAVLTLVSVWA